MKKSDWEELAIETVKETVKTLIPDIIGENKNLGFEQIKKPTPPPKRIVSEGLR